MCRVRGERVRTPEAARGKLCARATSGSRDPVIAQIADIGGIPMSALLIEVPRPRAVIVALHGGGTSSAYFDCPGHPELSLLRTAAAAGFTALALDRPGYGSSQRFSDRFNDPQVRVDAMYTAIDAHLGALPRGAGLFLAAHSAGCQLALRMSADRRGGQLLGLELGGTGRRRSPISDDILARPLSLRQRISELLWQPAHLYPPALAGGTLIGSGGPRPETAAGGSWGELMFPKLAARVRIPVHYSVGEHERVWRTDAEGLADVASTFTMARRLVLAVHPHSGHNLSVGYAATAYHLSLLAFAEECVLAREISDSPIATTLLNDSVKG
ncbi:alpha/beta hydrolase [Nocardia sp. NPDC006630]|uniref:alpha/beta hydrolase n=1 Tax=Nocardia sp. NPDC006630 TaxID=3157181 RepID=UPI0033AE1BEB